MAMSHDSCNLSGSPLAYSPDAAPPWFRTAMDQVTEKLDGLTAQMEGVNVRLDGVRDQVGSLHEQLNKVDRISAMVCAYFIFEGISLLPLSSRTIDNWPQEPIFTSKRCHSPMGLAQPLRRYALNQPLTFLI